MFVKMNLKIIISTSDRASITKMKIEAKLISTLNNWQKNISQNKANDRF
mgnify:CR=1 FL=1